MLLRSSLRGAIRISSESLRALFKPESVAVVGASAVPGRIGHAIMKNILEYGFSGVVYPVNPKYDEVMGLRCYHSVEELPGPVDMAVIAIPARLVPGVVDVLGEKGCRVAVVISSGFGEVGNRGLEEELVERARRRGMRVLGPNIFGVFYAPSRLNATFGPRDVIPGSIAFITQSGALGIALMGWTITEGIGLSALVSVGNKADIDDDDLIETLGEDESTRVIVIYMEGVRDGRRFMEAASRVSRVKPIIVVKAGRSERGRRAASSHTGALAGSDEVYSSAFRQAGVLRAGNVQEAFDWALAFSSGRTPRGDSVVIVTNGGGAGVLATDAAEAEGLRLIDPPDDLREEFRRCMPEFGSDRNPVDLTGQATDSDFEAAVRAALGHDSVSGVVVLYCETAVTDPEAVADAVLRAAGEVDKPVTVMMMGGERSERAMLKLRKSGVPAYPTPERAVSAMGAMVRWWRLVRGRSFKSL